MGDERRKVVRRALAVVAAGLLICQIGLAASYAGIWTGIFKISGFPYDAKLSMTSDGKFKMGLSILNDAKIVSGAYSATKKSMTFSASGHGAATLRKSLRSGVLKLKGTLFGYAGTIKLKKLVPKVVKTKAPAVSAGSASVISVLTNSAAQCVKMVDKNGKVLAKSDKKAADGSFTLKYGFSKNRNTVKIYAGYPLGDGSVYWGKGRLRRVLVTPLAT